MAETLDEQLSALADRIGKMALCYGDANSKSLLALQDRLIDLSNQAIAKEMQADEVNYTKALEQINQAIAIIGDGSKKIDKIDEAFSIVAKVIDFAVKAMSKAL